MGLLEDFNFALLVTKNYIESIEYIQLNTFYPKTPTIPIYNLYIDCYSSNTQLKQIETIIEPVDYARKRIFNEFTWTFYNVFATDLYAIDYGIKKTINIYNNIDNHFYIKFGSSIGPNPIYQTLEYQYIYWVHHDYNIHPIIVHAALYYDKPYYYNSNLVHGFFYYEPFYNLDAIILNVVSLWYDFSLPKWLNTELLNVTKISALLHEKNMYFFSNLPKFFYYDISLLKFRPNSITPDVIEILERKL